MLKEIKITNGYLVQYTDSKDNNWCYYSESRENVKERRKQYKAIGLKVSKIIKVK